jgi:hypothetical protein
MIAPAGASFLGIAIDISPCGKRIPRMVRRDSFTEARRSVTVPEKLRAANGG